MKLLVFSDSHHQTTHMISALEKEASTADACFYLGDGVRDISVIEQMYPSLALYAVNGNCDFQSTSPLEEKIVLGGLKIFYSHGHKTFVKNGVETLWKRARKFRANIALFGHTHTPYYEYKNGIHLFNPGSISLPHMGFPTYGIITIEDKNAKFNIFNIS